MRFLVTFTWIVCLHALSPSAQAVDLIDVKTLPAWFQKEYAREKKVTSVSKLELKEFGVNAKIKGKAKLVEKKDGMWYYYNIEIGTASPVECYAFSEYDGPANSLYSVIETSIEGVEQLNKKSLSGNYNFVIDTGVIGNTPYLAVDRLILLGEGDKKVLGTLKGLAAETGDTLEVCIQNEIGYQGAFFSVFESFVKAFADTAKNNEFFDTVFKMTLNGLPVGYSREQHSLDAEGDVYTKSRMAMVVPADEQTMSRSDVFSRSWSDVDGTLINRATYQIDNGVLSSDLSIVFDDVSWIVEGESQGKKIKSELDYKGDITSDYGNYLEIMALNNSKNTQAEYHMWAPEADPTVTIKAILSKVKDSKEPNFKLEMGPITADALVNENGTVKQLNMTQGSINFLFEPIYTKGAPNKQ